MARNFSEQATPGDACRTGHQAGRSETALLTGLSHDMRTPLNTILGFTRLALEHDLPPKVRQYLQRVNDAGESLMALLRGMADISETRARPLGAAKPVQTTSGAGPVQGRALRVLLAEDDPINQFVAKGFLENAGHRPTLVANGRDALAALACEPFDAVLMDISMPGMDGLEATRRIRAAEGPGVRGVPICALTAHAAHGDKERFLAAGMDAYLAKPFTSSDLLNVLARLDRC